MGPLKAKLSPTGCRRRSQRWKHEKDSIHYFWPKDGRVTWEKIWVAFRSWEQSPSNSQTESRSYNHNELNSANKSGFFLRAFRWGLSLVNTLISAGHTWSREPSHSVPDFRPRQPWANHWVLLEATMFVFVCYETVENRYRSHLTYEKMYMKRHCISFII